MTLPETERASLVCSTCKARKKGCDKVLPICGYCSKRSLQCWYAPYSALPEKGAAKVEVHDSVKHSVDIQALVWNQQNILSFECFNMLRVSSSWQNASSCDEEFSNGLLAFSEVVSAYVSYVLQWLNLQVAEVCHRFFEGFHQWLPAISPKSLIDRIGQPHSRLYSAEDSILLLAMCLIVLRPTLECSVKPRHEPNILYVMLKSCFARTQTVLHITVPLIQAGILIAAYEYASQQPERAYVSIEAGAAMAQVLDIGRRQSSGDEDRVGECSIMNRVEERNVWWSIVILERQVQEDPFHE